MSVYTSIKELMELYKITVTPNTQMQAINITYIILNRTRKFNITIG